MRTIVNATSNESIDLRYATIDILILKHAHTEVPLKLSECRIETLDHHKIQFKEQVGCCYATINRFTAKSGTLEASRIPAVKFRPSELFPTRRSKSRLRLM